MDEGGENLCKWLDGCASWQWLISWGVRSMVDGKFQGHLNLHVATGAFVAWKHATHYKISWRRWVANWRICTITWRCTMMDGRN